jgi:histidinol-phosphate aminotransferase
MKKIKQVEEYFNEKTRTLKPYTLSKRFGGNITKETVPLDWNESLFGPSEKVKKEIFQCLLTESFNLYPDGDSPELTKLIAQYTGLKEEQILTFNGSDSALHDCIFSLVSPKDKVAVIEPEYNQVDTFIHMAGGSKISFFPKDTFNIDIKELCEFLKENNCKYLYLSNPSNPVGRFILKDSVNNILETGVFLLLDEAYIQFTDEHCLDLIKEYKNIIIFRTFSKAMALAGLRLGYICSSKECVELVTKVRNPKEVNKIAQIAATSVMKNIEEVRIQIEQMKIEKKRFIEEIRRENLKIIVHDTHSNFILIVSEKYKKIIDELNDIGIYVRDRSSMYKMENTIRITIGRRLEMDKIIKIINRIHNEKNDNNI